jgi:hypothetical protein
MGEWLKKFFGRREVMAYGVTGTACYLAITGQIGPTEFVPLVTMVLAFYFSARTTEKEKEEKT